MLSMPRQLTQIVPAACLLSRPQNIMANSSGFRLRLLELITSLSLIAEIDEKISVQYLLKNIGLSRACIFLEFW